MSESSPIKDALYAKIVDIGQEQIHQLLLNGKFSELFEKIYGPVIKSVQNIEEYEKHGTLAESLTHYLFTEMLIPSQRKITFKNILQRLLNLIDKKRILLPFPLPLAKLSARFFEILPKPLLTSDQLRLLKYDNIASGKYKTNSDIGIPSKRYFNDEVKKYCYMWREGGQFSTEKYTSNDDLEKKSGQN